MLFALLLIANPEAIIVTHNGGMALDRPDLRYADDDGLQYAALFRQAGMRVTLLTQLDKESQLLHGSTAVIDGAPTREQLFAAVKRASTASEIYLVFAGHGDVQDGHGFLSLADGALTSAELEEHVLTPLDKARVHLIIDSCNSYFMVMPRKPGGTAFTTTKPESLLARHPKLNVLLSTSAEAVTYEWSELQSGIFSYVVRSALRGAADADGDGSISYTEMATFVNVATRSIENDAYRPHVFSRASSPALFLLPKNTPNELLVDGAHRLTLRSQKGVRLADVHSETSVRLWLPDERVSIEERQGQRLVQREIGPAQRAALSALTEAPNTVAQRGESPVFRSLFSAPFGQSAINEAASQPVEDEAYGVSKADVERWRTVLQERARAERAQRHTNAWMIGIASGALIAGGVPGLVMGLKDGYSNSPWLTGAMMAGTGVLTAGIGLPLLLARKTGSEKLFEELSQLKLDTQTSRSIAVARMSEHFLRLYQRQRSSQLTVAITATATAALGTAAAAATFVTVHPPRSWGLAPNEIANYQSNQITLGMTYAAIAGGMLVLAIEQFVTLPKKIASLDELQAPDTDKPKAVTFDGVSVGSDGKGVYGTAGLRF